MVQMKTTKCPTCGGITFQLAGRASALCHDECLSCRMKRKAPDGFACFDGDVQKTGAYALPTEAQMFCEAGWEVRPVTTLLKLK